MATVDIFEKLKQLQDILVEKYDLQAKVDEAPKQLDSQEELLERMKREFIEKNTEYDAVKENVSKLKFELDEAIRTRENGEKGMDNISTHREYEALEKQISEATAKENEIRKELQKNEKVLEEIKENLKSTEEMINGQEEDLAASKETLENQLADYKNSLTHLQAEEDKITPDLDQEILFKFQRIIQRNSEGIVAVKNGVCSGCHMILPAQFANTVRQGENIMFCPYCSRILFYEESENEDENVYSLADFDDFSYDDDDDSSIDEEQDDEDYENSDDSDDYDDVDDENDDQDLDDEVLDDEEELEEE